MPFKRAYARRKIQNYQDNHNAAQKQSGTYSKTYFTHHQNIS